MRRFVIVLTTFASLAAAPLAHAGIWTPMASGTTADIKAVDYRGPSDIYYATGDGKIFHNGTLQLTAASGTSFTDIEFNPAGTIGLASANQGRLYRYSGSTWAQVTLPMTYGGTCTGSGGPYTKNYTVTGNLTAVSWADNTTAWVPAFDHGVLFKLTNNASTITDVSRQANGTCFALPINNSSTSFSDVAAIGNSVYITTTDDGRRVISSNGFTSAGTDTGDDPTLCGPYIAARMALDRDNPSRSWLIGTCPNENQFPFSSDTSTSYNDQVFPQRTSGDNTYRGVDAAGGSAVAVGDSGAIDVSLDGAKAYTQPADGADASVNWFAVDKYDAAHAAVVGANGQLLVTNQANTIPDIVAPTGTITGPSTVTVGQPATFTANVADEAGGSGIDPNGFSWSATGIPTAAGNPVSLTFPSAGYYTLHVTVKDKAGNASTADFGVTVSSPPVATTPPVKTVPMVPVSMTPKPTTVSSSGTVAGGTVKLSAPSSCIPVGKSFKATLSFKRSTKKGTKAVKVTKVDFTIDKKKKTTDKKAPFVKTVSVKALKAGSKHKVTARATIKVKKGKSPTKSVSVSFTVCG